MEPGQKLPWLHAVNRGAGGVSPAIISTISIYFEGEGDVGD